VRKTINRFSLIETLLWIKGDGYFLFDEHLTRLASSADELHIPYDRGAILQALECAVIGADCDRLRVRLVLDQAGHCTVSVAALNVVPEGTVWRVALAQSPIASTDPMLRHKTTLRDRYDSELSRANAYYSADEVIFLNERAEICEGARSNVFVARDTVLLTPPLSSGLLPGTLRANLLASGRAREATLRLDDIAGNVTWYMGNSVRGLVRARVIT
jgi:4-amino-4-deoxychorismate lyase